MSILDKLLSSRSQTASQDGNGLLQDEDYRHLVGRQYLSLAQIVFDRQRENLLHQTSRLYNPGLETTPFEELVQRKRRSRREFLEVKLFLDWIDSMDPRLGEIEEFYARVLREDYYQEIRNHRFKEPFDFILKVPVTHWIRYKTTLLPRPRVLGSLLAREKARPRRRSLWRLFSKNRSRAKFSRPRGYRDKGHLASKDSLVRTKINLEYQRLKYEFERLEERRVFLFRAKSNPARAAGLFIQELKSSPVWAYLDPGPTWQETVKSFRDKHGGKFGH